MSIQLIQILLIFLSGIFCLYQSADSDVEVGDKRRKMRVTKVPCWNRKYNNNCNQQFVIFTISYSCTHLRLFYKRSIFSHACNYTHQLRQDVNKFGRNVRVSPMMNPTDFRDPLTSPLLPP